MATYVTMPKLGLTMTEGTVTVWSSGEGDNVKQGQVIATVATDKLTYEVEAPEDGSLLKILVKEGDSVPVGENLAVIGKAGEKVEESASAAAEPEPREEEKVEKLEETAEEQKPEPEEKTSEPVLTGSVKASPLAKKWARIFGLSLADIAGTGPEGRIVRDDVMNAAVIFRASPLAKKVASENGLDITEIPGTGPGGRTVKEDVIRFMEEGGGKPKASPVAVKLAEELGVDLASIDKTERIMKEDVLAAAGVSEEAEAPTMPAVPSEQAGGEKRVPLSTMRKVIAERMTQSAQTIPSVVFNVEVDFTEIIAFRNRIKEQVAASGAKLSFNDILMKICSRALTEHPMANASYDKDSSEYILHSDVNIGLAVAVEGGLLVPNVKSVQSKSLQEIASETDSLVEKSRKGALSMDDMQGGTFTISNLGMFGMHDFTPIINPPEACILAVNAIEEKPVVRNGEIVIRPISNLGLTADHRILDGADAAKFLARIRELIENPYLLLV
jgi:pyruvate dehydrogenase E2 component (dihydrolipoamide acetyltransferase)